MTWIDELTEDEKLRLAHMALFSATGVISMIFLIRFITEKAGEK